MKVRASEWAWRIAVGAVVFFFAAMLVYYLMDERDAIVPVGHGKGPDVLRGNGAA